MKLRPINDILLIKLGEDQWTIRKPEFIEIPEGYVGRYKKRAIKGTIVKFGSGCEYKHKIGEKIIFRFFSNRPHVAGLRILQEGEILMKLKPLGSKILIKVDAANEKTSGGIFIPDNAKEEKSQGEVISIGEKVKEVKKGDRLIFGKYSGDELIIDGKIHKIIEEKETLVVI